MQKPRVVSPAELQAALTVWMKTLPRHVWEKYAKLELKRLDKRETDEDRIDPREELAKHLVAKFVQANWQASYVPANSAFEAVEKGFEG